MSSFIPTAAGIAPVLRNIRKQKHLTQIETAERTGLLPKTVSLPENNPGNYDITQRFSKCRRRQGRLF